MPRLEDEKAEKVQEDFPWFIPAPLLRDSFMDYSVNILKQGSGSKF